MDSSSTKSKKIRHLLRDLKNEKHQHYSFIKEIIKELEQKDKKLKEMIKEQDLCQSKKI